MKRCVLLTIGLCAVAAVAQAQSAPTGAAADPVSTEVRQSYTRIKDNLTKLAEKVPEDQYGFKPTPDIRTLGELVAHVADSQAGTCSMVNGASEPKRVSAGKTTKADLVAALKESFAICDTAFDALTDANGNTMFKAGTRERSKMGTLAYVVAHSNEEYGYMAVYLRLKGIVPPSSEKR